MQKKSSYQEEFFRTIKENIPAYENLAQGIANVLSVSVNEAYKKIKGSSQLTTLQIIRLCEYYKVSFNYVPSTGNSVVFSYDQLESKGEEMENHLRQILEKLNVARQLKTKRLIIVSDDIPFFYLFKYPELGLFKVAFWESSMRSDTPVYDPLKMPEIYKQLIMQIHDSFMQIPTTEIWSKNATLSTIEQVKYAFDAGKIADKATAVKIANQLKSTLTDMQSYAVNGSKNNGANESFEWFNADVVGTIVFLLEIGTKMVCFTRFNTFHIMETSDSKYCQKTKDWIDRLIKKSICFSGQGEKYRNQYLNVNIKSCNELADYCS